MLLWLDLETTGLDSGDDFIVEVAWTVTDSFLHSHHPEITSFVVTPTTDVFERLESNPFVTAMHEGTGLKADMETGDTLLLEDIEDRILADIERDSNGDPWYLAGASVHFDLGFIRIWMPRLAAKLSHRVYDTSTLKAFFEEWIALPPTVANVGEHRAKNDVAEVLGIARHYREQMHVASHAIETFTQLGLATRAPEAQR